MAHFELTAVLRAEYAFLFRSCRIRPERIAEVDALATRIESGRARYEGAGGPTGVPWFAIGAIHCMETGLRFDRHLHNGDPLTARTVHVPAGWPRNGAPPFTWEHSANDALVLQGLDRWRDWSAEGLLYVLEGYNGWGYRRWHPHVKSPYLWSFSTHYTSGKYVADGTWSDTAVSKQCGAAVLLRRMAEQGRIELAEPVAAPAPLPPQAPRIRFWRGGPEIQGARDLQEFLNRQPGVTLRVDGKPGEDTSEAVRQVLGHYLVGDPRA